MSDDDRDQQRDEPEGPWLPAGVTASDEDVDLEDTDEREDEEDDDDDLLESYGQDLEAPWAPVPVSQARDFRKATPSANLDLIFPEAYAEDRSAKLKDLAVAQGLDYFTHERAATQAAQEFGFAQYDYHAEMHAIRLEKAKWGDILGQGDGLAGRVAGVTPRPSEDEEDERELWRADVSGTAQHAFRRQQREVILVERDPQTQLISKLVTEAAAPLEGTSPAPPPPLGFDPERFLRERRERLLQAKRQAEAASPPAPATPQPIHAEPADLDAELRAAVVAGADIETLSPGLRAPLLHEGRQLERAKRLPEGPTLEKETVGYTFADTTRQLSLGVPVVACGACTHFRPPATPSAVGGCKLVIGAIKGTDQCNRFVRSRTGRALAR